jgi:hypothetical protein
MSREIARMLVEDKLNELRKLSYGELFELVGQVSCDGMSGPDGKEYQVETEISLGPARPAAMSE